MTLPASGVISINSINVELGVSGTTNASLGQSSFRTLAGIASGAISMSNFYGKANEFTFYISSNQTNANLRTLAVNSGWNQSSKVNAIINSGIFVYATSTGSYALTINGSFPGGVTLTNNGTIQGQGGNGGYGSTTVSGLSAGAGAGAGPALSVSVGVTITNNNRIAGGGGGGGGGGGRQYQDGKRMTYLSGGMGGGGLGGNGGTGYPAYVTPAGGNGSQTTAGGGSAGEIGRPSYNGRAGNGGSGGSYGEAGGAGEAQQYGSAGGGAGGAAINGNGNINWVAFGTRNGGIS
jgi:hypothetical protein